MFMRHLQSFCIAAAIMVTACTSGTQSKLTTSGLDPERFDTIIDNSPTKLFVLKNQNGMEVCITNFGARIVSIMVPDNQGKLQDVVLGFDNIHQYADLKNSPTDFGATIGRYANRIKQGKLTVDGHTYQLPQNNFGHCLHGGPTGWQYKVFREEMSNDTTLQLSLFSPDGDNNFPGNVHASVTFTLTSKNSIDISYKAVTDKPTVINMTNHSYFNLNGKPETHGMNQKLFVNAKLYTPTDSTFIPTGQIVTVKNTPMDFRQASTLEKVIAQQHFPQIKYANGIDHNFCLNTYTTPQKYKYNICAASLYSPLTGILLQVYTTEPGIQVYTGNFLNGTLRGKHGIAYPQRASVCLETQHFPDSPNNPQWPQTWLHPGETYTSHTSYHFSIQ